MEYTRRFEDWIGGGGKFSSCGVQGLGIEPDQSGAAGIE